MSRSSASQAPVGAPPRRLMTALGAVLCLFTLVEVNYPNLGPQSQLALFALFGITLAILGKPLQAPLLPAAARRTIDLLLIGATALCCLYIVSQTERFASGLWIGGRSLGDRAGQETSWDTVVAILGLLVVVEATRRSIGWALPILAAAFAAYALFGQSLPDWLMPHRGYSLERFAGQTFLQGQGVFGIALSVMFRYVFLFVVFGAILEATGATGFVIDFARRLFRRSPGGAAKVAVLSSGLMGSLSGSAVANTAATGTFTIPMMRSAGLPRRTAAAVEAAASSGGALMPPIMGAGAYMMLELIPGIRYLEILRAALLPALLYYVSLFLIVHFLARRIHHAEEEGATDSGGAANLAVDGASSDEARASGGAALGPATPFAGVVFAGGLGVLIVLLLMGYTPFRAVSVALVAAAGLGLLHPETRLNRQRLLTAAYRASQGVVPLVTAAACVGIVIGVVALTGIGTRLPALVLPLAQDNLLLALILIMVSSIVLGMGLPSAVCYLLIATLMGPVLGQLGVVPLAAHLFIFYFGMMSMVTPPVALAAYAAASIAGSDVLKTGVSAFRFALVGFTLPYLFVLRPELLLLSANGETAAWGAVAESVLVALLGILSLAAGIVGFLIRPLGPAARAVCLLAALLFLVPAGGLPLGGVEIPVVDLLAAALFAGAAVANGWRRPAGSV